VASLRRGGWMEVTLISRGVEISIAGGGEETKDAVTIVIQSSLYRDCSHNPNPVDSPY